MSNNSFEIYKTFVASTGHVEDDDFEAIRAFPEIFSYDDHNYGMRIFLGKEMLDQCSTLKISEGLRLLILFAISNDCRYLDLDSDGPLYDDFPQYDW